jgi:hypothetical protein
MRYRRSLSVLRNIRTYEISLSSDSSVTVKVSGVNFILFYLTQAQAPIEIIRGLNTHVGYG